jgi:glyoxylase-like metal-dependent hydrolase (beta-lactamase superfamily II)
MYHMPAEKLLVGGDLIIGGSVGRTDLPDSDERELMRSIVRVMKRPGDTRLVSGHGPPTLLSHERDTNPFVQIALREIP